MNDRVISRLEELGVSLFRINLSHTKLEDLEERIRFIQERSKVPICLDTEGAQVRTADLACGPIQVENNDILKIHRLPVVEDRQSINFYPSEIVDSLQVGDLISIDFNSVLIQAIHRNENIVETRVLIGGTIGQNKAVTVERDLLLEPLTEKDREALKIGKRLGIRHVALSFASRASDADEVRLIAGQDICLISKVESLQGLENLEAIAQKSDALLIDRGDLSRQVPIEQIPAIQKMIIQRGKKSGVRVYVATNLLESMINASTPTRAEVNDIYNTLADGADGLVLAAETAIGRYPINCVAMSSKVIQVFEHQKQNPPHTFSESIASLLIPPHGGGLVQCWAAPDDLAQISSLKKLKLRETDLMDAEQIAVGTYSPLRGFMTKEELQSVLDRKRLPNETVWPLPVVLQVSQREAGSVCAGEKVALTDSLGKIQAVMDIQEIYSFDFQKTASLWFGTISLDHPGVRRLYENGDRFIGGKIGLVQRRTSEFAPYELTPSQIRFLFEKKGWQKVVGFHSRNVAHRVHEYLQLTALERYHADGLLISPVTGPKKSGDFLAGPILKSYQLMIDRDFYPKGKVALVSFSTYSRYAGPREAVFTALCRKNMGCSHFILGRDHTGVGDFYASDSNKKIFDEIGPIGITPVFFDSIGYDPKGETYGPAISIDQAQIISGSVVREKLRQGEQLPDWFMRREVQDLLISDIRSNTPVFCS